MVVLGESGERKVESEQFFQGVSESKRKMGEAKRRWEEEAEEMKTSHEAELASLRDRMRKEKSVASSATTEQLQQLEKELEEQWKGRAERQVASMEERWRRKMEEMKEEKNALEEQLKEASAKVRGERESFEEYALSSTEVSVATWCSIVSAVCL